MSGYFAHCAYTRAFSLRVSRKVFLRVHARFFSLIFAAVCFEAKEAPGRRHAVCLRGFSAMP